MSKVLVDYLEEIKSLMELRGENPFKIRAFDKAASALESMGAEEDWVARAKAGTLTEIPGIGKGISAVITEFLIEGKTTTRDELAAGLPEGLTELTRVPGLGPKKALQLIEELGIKSLAELEYACKENRLLKLKGFGDKVQAKILAGARFLMANSGMMRLSDALPIAGKLVPILQKAANLGRRPAGGGLRVSETGTIRRRLETVASLEFMVETMPGEKTTAALEERLYFAVRDAFGAGGLPVPVKFYYAAAAKFGEELARTTATPESWKALEEGAARGKAPLADLDAKDEETFFQEIDLPWIPPEMRETGEEVALAKKGELSKVLPWDGLRGCFHNHTDRSDGIATLEQMVLAAKQRGMQYIGISDHSKSAFYAHGLDEVALDAQEGEIRKIQEKHPDIRIFWGIESDILADGGLDYDAARMERFDFVVASIHSRFQMDRTTMTERILEAIRHPTTTMLGHLTGRLLLGRKGYDLDVETIIRECAKLGVAIEINAHPARLDIDWRYGPDLRREKCMVSINPDAHETEGLDDIRWGIGVARKALLPSELVLNSRGTQEVEAWIRK